jgi:hypothetical protein
VEATKLSSCCSVIANLIVRIWNEIGWGVYVKEGEVEIVENINDNIIGDDIVYLTPTL